MTNFRKKLQKAWNVLWNYKGNTGLQFNIALNYGDGMKSLEQLKIAMKVEEES